MILLAWHEICAVARFAVGSMAYRPKAIYALRFLRGKHCCCTCSRLLQLQLYIYIYIYICIIMKYYSFPSNLLFSPSPSTSTPSSSPRFNRHGGKLLQHPRSTWRNLTARSSAAISFHDLARQEMEPFGGFCGKLHEIFIRG